MDVEQAVDLIWNEAREGRYFPEPLRGKLDLPQALRVQLGLLERKKARGGKQFGWKVGLTSPRVRQRFGTDARPFGHIMSANVQPVGGVVSLDGIQRPAIEPELCFFIGRTLKGPGVTPEQAYKATRAASAAFELNENRAGDVQDFPLTVADDLSQWGLVVGAPFQPAPPSDELELTQVSLVRNGTVVEVTDPRKADIDDHYLSLSVLANTLADYGLALEAGMHVITGSFTKRPVERGEYWEATLERIGSVEVRFR